MRKSSGLLTLAALLALLGCEHQPRSDICGQFKELQWVYHTGMQARVRVSQQSMPPGQVLVRTLAGAPFASNCEDLQP